MAAASPSRTIHVADANAWLRERSVLEASSVITSMPDVSELPHLSLADWREWFSATAARLVELTPPDGVSIFFQTDVKKEGAWVDKGYLVMRGAERAGGRLLFHKVVCRAPPGAVTFGRPAYSHLLGFSRGLSIDLSRASADVLPEAGETSWTRGMGVNACAAACRYVLQHTPTRTVVDPFCGHGSVLAVANALGLDAVGVELSKKRAKKARNLVVELSRHPRFSPPQDGGPGPEETGSTRPAGSD